MSESPERTTLEARHQMSDIDRLRHSCAHIMASALLRLWPDAQLAAGPPIDNGFFYDIELDHRISSDDFEKIEAEMKKIVKENSPFTSEIITRAQALALAQSGRLGALSERAVPSKYKVDILENIPEDEQISLYHTGDFVDLCAGPHVGRTGNCKAFKIMNIASAFYKGDKTKPMLQRLYATCFPNRIQLEEHLTKLEEARRRDHRRIGKDMNLFTIDEAVGQGLVLWKPKGALLRRSLQDFILEELDKLGYSQVYTPHIGKLDLYRTSGHFPYYEESQFPAFAERDTLEKFADENVSCAELLNSLRNGNIEGYMLKPMNCPHHIKIYDSQAHSYRDLPVRLAEFGTVYRWEQSGELGGMTRVRGFTQDDAHIFCTPDQLSDEIRSCLGIVKTILGTLGMEDYRVRLSLRDPDSTKYVGDPENWDKAEAALRACVIELGASYTEEPGEAAFYGPKIDFIVKDVIGREWQLGTVQVDYNLPERFNLSYVGADNKAHRPVMVHRAPFGSMERFCGLLIEHFEGKFPAWLAPEQIRILPISEKYEDDAERVRQALGKIRARVSIDNASEKIGAKIRNAQLDKVAYMLIVGQKEAETHSVSIRHRDLGDLGTVPIEQFCVQFKQEVDTRSLSPIKSACQDDKN